MKRRYKRYRSGGGVRLSPWAIAGIVLGAVILLTLLVGNLLKLWLDDETYQRLTQGDPTPPPEEEILLSSVPAVNAYPWQMGDSMTSALDLPAVSVPINAPDGSLLCSSPVADRLGMTSAKDIPLRDTVQELADYSPYISGVLYTQGLYETDPYVRYAMGAAEGALLREFFWAGGEEAVLAGIPFSTLTLAETVQYVKEIKKSAGGNIGVAIPWELLSLEGGWETVGSLLTVCDFCLLDVTNAAATPADILEAADYFLKQYQMRVFASASQTEWKTELEERMYGNYQIVDDLRTTEQR